VPDPTDDRAVSEILGYSLIFGMILVAIAFVSVSGFASLEDARDAEQNNNAERAFDVLANNVEDVYRRGAPSRATELSLGGSQLYVDDEVTLRVTVDDGTGPEYVETTFRPIVFRGRGQTEFVYEAGAVFRDERDGGITVRDLPLRLDGDRLILPVVGVNTENVQSIGGPAVLVRTAEVDREIAFRSSGGHDVEINVTDSPREAIWKRHLEGEFGMDCSYSGESLLCDDGSIDPDRVLVVVHDIDVVLET
jgi:hypothetical protein